MPKYTQPITMALSDFTGKDKNSNPNNGNGGNSGSFSQSISAVNPGNGSNQNNASGISGKLINYNKKYKAALPALFRDTEITETISILTTKLKPNVLLNGPAGVGKTKIAEELARRIAIGDPCIPDTLKDKTIYEMPLSSMVSGNRMVGDLEETIEEVINFFTDPANKAILFIDEIHQLVDEHNPIYQKVAQILKPALARGDMRTIGSTTTQEIRNFLNDPAMNRRFQTVSVPELSPSETVAILQNAKPSFLAHHQVIVTDAILPDIVTLADNNKKAGQHRPDNALTLMDRAMADARIERDRLKANAATNSTIQTFLQNSQCTLTIQQIKKTAQKTLIGHHIDSNTQSLSDAFKAIKGQETAVNTIIEEMNRRELNLFPKTKPDTFLFAGPSGVGKSEIAKILSQALFNEKPIILNMTEFNHSSTINRIIGSPAGYVGSTSNDELPFDILDTNPCQVILLDEFEKCHPAVKTLFMSAFEEGVIKTNRNKPVDFSKSIIIATTNAGADRKEIKGFKNPDGNETARPAIDGLKQDFKLELLNRFTKIINFNNIPKETYAEILKDKYRTEVERIRKNRSKLNLPDELSNEDVTKLTEETYEPNFGARPAYRTIQKFIEDLALAATAAQSKPSNN